MGDLETVGTFLVPRKFGRLDHGEGEIKGSLHHYFPNFACLEGLPDDACFLRQFWN